MTVSHDDPGLKGLVRWLRAYPRLNDHMERIIWRSVFMKYWGWPFIWVLVFETFWHSIFHFFVFR